MASAQERFDSKKIRDEIFESRNRDILMTIMFVAETAALLREKGRKSDFVFIADRSIEILHGYVMLKKILLKEVLSILHNNTKPLELLKYYLICEKLLDDSFVDKSTRMVFLVEIGKAYICSAHYKNAIEYTLTAEKIANEIKSNSVKLTCYTILGNAYYNLYESQKAIDYFKRGLQISIKIGDQRGIASHNTALGNAYYRLADYEKAIDYTERSLQISIQIGIPSEIAINNRNLGNAFLRLGDYEKAIDYYKISLEINTKIGDRLQIANDNVNLGNVFFSSANYQKVIDYSEIGLNIFTEIGDRSAIARTNGNLGSAYLKSGEPEKAIDYLEKCFQIYTEIGDRSGIARNNSNLGLAYCVSGDYNKSIILYQKCLQISKEIGERSLIAKANANLGISYLLQGHFNVDNEEAVSKFQQAAGCLEESVKYRDEIFAGLAVDENKISFTKECHVSYKLLMFCFIFLKRIEAALLIIDLGKAKALHAFLENQNKSGCDILSDYTRKTWKRIHNNEENMQTKEIENILALKTNNSTVFFFSFDMLEVLTIWVVNGEDNSNIHIIMCSTEGYIYDNLKKLLKFFSVDLKRDFSFNKLDSDSISSEQMTIDAQLLRKLVNDETNSKFQRTPCPKNQPGDNTPETPECILRNLYRVLIEPVKDWIKGTKLIIVPDKFLFFLPFCALLDENDCQLSENYCIEITPSLHTLVSSITRPRDSSLGFALFVGNPTVGKIKFGGNNIQPSELPNATKEVKCLASLFEAEPLVEGEATKDRVLRFINGASIIHIAAHGDSKRGEIFLSPIPNMTTPSSSFPEEDSYLLKQEDIMEIGINAKLVVLSCCHTGQGEISCEGVVGLTRAFLAAGARSVVATLWPIHDEGTKEFMNIFYEKICNEISVCEALRTTMNMFHRHENEEFRSLQMWAPFTIYGEDVRFTNGDIEEIKGKSRQFNEKIKSI